MEIFMIVAAGKDGAIGRNGDLIWHIPADLKRFKQLTSGHPVIMGRKTWESLPKKPLPGRLNIVVTRNHDFEAQGALVASSPEEAISLCGGTNEDGSQTPFIIGGEQIYKSFLPFADKLYLTLVDRTFPDADAWFPLPGNDPSWILEDSSEPENSPSGLPFRYLTFKRNNPQSES